MLNCWGHILAELEMPLTDAQCRNAKCPAQRARARYADSHGLYLEVLPGGGKYWRLPTVTVRLKTVPPQVLKVYVDATWRGRRTRQIVQRARPSRCDWGKVVTRG